MSEEKGRVSKIAGPVVDVAFPLDALPELNFALEVDVTIEGQSNTIILEVAQHLGEGKIRAISMQGTDGLQRGAEVTNTGAPISVPVGLDKENLPIGMQLIGNSFDEESILSIASCIEKSAKFDLTPEKWWINE